MKAVCPKNTKHKQFITTAHVMEEWVVTEDGDYIKTMGCLEVTHSPDRDNIWICKMCGAEATFQEENRSGTEVQKHNIAARGKEIDLF